MENEQEKRPSILKLDPKTAGIAAACGAVLLLLVLLCINIVMRTQAQSEYTKARNEVGEEIYTQLYMLCQTFDQIDVPGKDVENTIIPTMKDYYLAARTLNEVLANAFSQSYNVLPQETQSVIDAAFEAYDAAFRGGRPREEAQRAMKTCMNMVRDILDSRFRDGVLMAA